MDDANIEKVLDGVSDLLYGGGSEPPDHCYWGGAAILNAVKEDSPNMKPELLKKVDAYLKQCKNESIEEEEEDEEGDEDGEEG